MVYVDPNDIKNKSTAKHPSATGIRKCEILFLDTRMVSRRDDTRPTLVITNISSANP